MSATASSPPAEVKLTGKDNYEDWIFYLKTVTLREKGLHTLILECSNVETPTSRIGMRRALETLAKDVKHLRVIKDNAILTAGTPTYVLPPPPNVTAELLTWLDDHRTADYDKAVAAKFMAAEALKEEESRIDRTFSAIYASLDIRISRVVQSWEEKSCPHCLAVAIEKRYGTDDPQATAVEAYGLFHQFRYTPHEDLTVHLARFDKLADAVKAVQKSELNEFYLASTLRASLPPCIEPELAIWCNRASYIQYTDLRGLLTQHWPMLMKKYPEVLGPDQGHRRSGYGTPQHHTVPSSNLHCT